MQVIIMRGIPGSGKSSFVQNLRASAISAKIPFRSISTDDSMTDLATGEYEWSFEKMKEGHAHTLREFIHLVKEIRSEMILVVDNTNCRERDIAPYIRIAEAYEVSKIRIIKMICRPEVALHRQKHGVPHRTIENMAFELGKSLCAEWERYQEIHDTN